jgi:SAM-dependent methyltransferase
MEKYLYDDLFELEDSHWWHISKRRTVRTFISRFCNKKNLKILDMGCGTGKNMEELSAFGDVFGIDSSAEAVAYCRTRGQFGVRKGSTYNSGFSANSFDLITLLDVLEHTDDHKTLTEVKRLLVSGGNVLITVPAFSWLWSRWDEVLHHRRRYNKKMLEVLLEREGFELVKSSYLYSFLVVPAFLIRWIKTLSYNKSYSSDFKLTLPIINKLMVLICDMERTLMMKFSIPFGTSLVVLARKIN